MKFLGGFKLDDPFNVEPNALLALQRSRKCKGKDANEFDPLYLNSYNWGYSDCLAL